ncbi:MAG: FAD:protein FMN transferase, partial [Phycisphaerales bacterium]
PGSEVNRLCAAPSGTAHEVSEDLFATFERAAMLSAATNGRFDISLGPCASLWRAARKSGRLPTDNEIETARARCGRELIMIARDPHTGRPWATLARPNMQLDLGGIGKGLAAAEGVAVLRRFDCPRGFVALAGDIAVGEPPPGTGGWRVAVMAGTGPTTMVLELANTCVSTSGDREQYVEIGGRRYSHILDPATGLGTAGGVAATVVAPLGGIADGLATAACIPGSPAPERLAAAFDRCAIIVVPSPPLGPVVIDPHGVLRWAEGDGTWPAIVGFVNGGQSR